MHPEIRRVESRINFRSRLTSEFNLSTGVAYAETDGVFFNIITTPSRPALLQALFSIVYSLQLKLFVFLNLHSPFQACFERLMLFVYLYYVSGTE